MKTFTTYAEKKAKQILNLLQGYTKGIRITAILILLLMGVSNASAYYLYLYTGDFTSWGNDYAAFKVGQSGNTTGDKFEWVALNWYRCQTTKTGMQYIKRCNPDATYYWNNQFSVNISSTNHVVKATGWNSGSLYSQSPMYISGNEWGNLANWKNDDISGKMEYDGNETFSITLNVENTNACKFKIVYYKTWDNAIAFSNNVSCVNGTVKDDGTNDHNIQFTPQNPGDVTITYNVSTGQVVITCAAPTENKFNVTAVANPTAGGTVKPTTETLMGQNTGGDITATANTGYTFTNWEINSGSGYFGESGTNTTSTTADTKFRPTADASIQANFTEIMRTITVTVDNASHGTVNKSTVTAGIVTGSDEITVRPGAGYEFVNWTATDGITLADTESESTKVTKATKNGTVTANFQEKKYSITITSNDNNKGTVSPTSKDVGQHTAVSITATPKTGYRFVNWTATDGITITDATATTTTIKATKAGTVTANFDVLPPKTIYLKANGDWKAASALQYVKYNDIQYKLDNLGCYAGEYFTTEIPATVTNFTFLRKNPDNTSEVWNETAKLTVPTNDKVLYDMTSTNIKYIYLKPNDDWKKDGAKFEACFNSTEYIQLEDIGNGLYRCENKGGKVQFNRVNPTNGYNKWNQTSDLTILSDKNCFNITSWDGGEWTMLWDDTFWTTYNAPNVRIHIEKILNGIVKLGTWTSGNTANDIDVPINSEFVLSITPAAGYVLKNCRIKIGDNAEEEGINGKSYTICGPTTLSAEFEIPVNEITITGKDRVYDGTRVDYNQNNGWVSGNGTESNPYTLYIDEAARITISPLPERTGLTAYYKFGTNTEQTDNVFDWETIGTTPTTLTVTAYYKDALGNKSIETQVTSPYFKMIPLPFYLMTSPNNEINIDRVAAGENIIVQFRSDAAASVGLFCRKNNEATEESLISISQTTLYDYEYDVDNRIEPCVLHFIARAEEEVHGRRFIEEADIAIYRNVIIKINDPDGWVKNAYMWRDYSDAILTQWPGDPVLQNFGTWRVFSVKYPYYDRFIVNEGLQEGGKQTVDWILPDKNMCYNLINPEDYTHANDEDQHKYGLIETDCPNNLLVEDIEDITITEGEQFVVMPKIYVGLGFTLSDVEAEVTFDNPRCITAMMSGTNITVLGRAIGESNITVAYTLNNERIEERFKVTVEKNTHIAIQVKVPVNLDPDGDNMEWVNENSIYIRYWGNGISHTNLNMTYMYTDGTYKYAQARIPLDNNEEINFFFYYENYDIENENWRQTNWIQNVRTRGCYEVLKDGEFYNRGWRRDGDNCADSYQIKILMGNGKIYTSNIVNDDTQTLSFFAPGKNETGYKSGAVMLYYNNNMIATIDPATFETSNVYVATLNDALNNITNVAVYSGNFYIRTWGTDGDISNKGWNSIHDWTNSEKASRTFTEFVSREYEFYNHYWVQAMNKGNFDGKDVRACVANDYNDDLAGELKQDKNTDEHGDIKLDSEVKIINVRFGYDPRTNYFGRAVLKGSEYENYLNLHCDNAYADKNCTKKLPYKTVSNTDNKFRDISNWVYERDIYVQITNETPSASLYIEAKSPKKDANVTNHLLGYLTNEVTGEETTTPIQRIVIGSGTDNGVYLVRVVYDFKTNRLIAAWLPQGTVDVSTEKTIDADVLFVRKENEEVPQINLSSQGKIKSLESMFFAIELHRDNTDINQRHQEQYWFTLPFDCKVGSISGVHGYMQIWGIQRYNGKKRAENGWFNPSTTFWEWLTPDDVMHAGEGYLLVFDKKTAPWNEIEVDKTDADGNIIYEKDANGNIIYENGKPKAEKEIISLMRLYFPSTESGFDMQQQSDEHLMRTYENHTCTITTANRDLQDSNWKVIGTTSYNNAGISGYTKDSDPVYEELSDAPSFRYQYEYTMSNDNKTFWYKYTPENGQTATYKSFYGYMVQFAGTINWQPIMSETVPDHIAARRYVPANERTSYTTRLELANAAGEVQDLTFVALDEKATTGFDQNKDLNKVLNRGTNIYTFVEGLPFAGNTLPMEKVTVPVGVRVATAGEYTFRMPDGTDGIAVTLVDNATGTHTNMLMSEYTVTLNAGTIENRFYLVVDPDRTATSVENIGEEAKGDKAKDVEKFLIDGKLFIRTADGIFDAKGQRM